MDGRKGMKNQNNNNDKKSPARCSGKAMATASGDRGREAEYDDYASCHSSASTDTPRAQGRGRRRPLGGFEYFMWKAHKMGCGLIYCIADIGTVTKEKKPVLITPEVIQKAALLCCKRHPNLRATITEDGYIEELSFHEYCRMFPVEVPLITGKNAVEFTEEELLSTHIAHGDKQLWQLFLVQDTDGQEQQQQQPHLVSFVHHTIMDGESVVLFLQEVLDNANKLSSSPETKSFEELLQEVVPLGFLESQDVLYEKLLTVEGDGWRSNLSFLWKRLTWLLRRPTVPTPETYTEEVHARYNQIMSTQIQGEDFIELLRRCKEEKTSVTAAIAAAVMQELKTLLPEHDAPALKIETMVNLRNLLVQADPSLAPSLHLFAAPIDMVLVVEKDDDDDDNDSAELSLWRRARSYKEALNVAMAAGQWKHQVAAFHTFRRFNDAVYRMLEGRVSRGPAQGRVKATAISNLGRLDAKLLSSSASEGTDAKAEFTITRLQWGITEHGIGQYVFVAASSQGESLNLTLTTVHPLVSRPRAQRLLKGLVRRLKEGVQTPSSK